MARRAAAALVLVLACGVLAGLGSPNKAFQPRFDAKNFTGATIDNPWFPLKPGTTWIYRGDGGVRDIVIVTRQTQKILGVSCTVVRDRVFQGGKLAERTFDWYAQDKDGNVWYLGEATEELENEKVTSREGSWQAGVRGAKPGVIMQADPKVGDSYRQEYYKGHAEDHAQVLSLRASVKVPAGSYSGVQLTKEWSPLEPQVLDHKFYARGIGLVKELTVKGGRERVVLVRVSR